jgi:ubiquinone/menaquinone biosynthesis C-methylase UbiE
MDDRPERKDGWSEIADPAQLSLAIRRLVTLGLAPSEVEARRRYLDVLFPRPGEMIVDVGAGVGLVSQDMARRVAPGGRIFAVDPSQGMIDHGRAAALESGVGHLIDFRVADGRKLPFGVAAFDASFCHWVLLHVDPAQAIVSEMKRVTRRGGRVMCVEVDWETVIVQPGDRELTRRILHHSVDRHVDGWSGRRLSYLLKSAGLAEVMIEPIVSVDQGGGDRAWLDFLKERAFIARQADVISGEESGGWIAALDEAFGDGRFFFAVTQFAAIGRVPE